MNVLHNVIYGSKILYQLRFIRVRLFGKVGMLQGDWLGQISTNFKNFCNTGQISSKDSFLRVYYIFYGIRTPSLKLTYGLEVNCFTWGSISPNGLTDLFVDGKSSGTFWASQE